MNDDVRINFLNACEDLMASSTLVHLRLRPSMLRREMLPQHCGIWEKRITVDTSEFQFVHHHCMLFHIMRIHFGTRVERGIAILTDKYNFSQTSVVCFNVPIKIHRSQQFMALGTLKISFLNFVQVSLTAHNDLRPFDRNSSARLPWPNITGQIWNESLIRFMQILYAGRII